MKAWPAIVLLPLLAACVADEAAQKAATTAYADCTMAAVKRFVMATLIPPASLWAWPGPARGNINRCLCRPRAG